MTTAYAYPAPDQTIGPGGETKVYQTTSYAQPVNQPYNQPYNQPVSQQAASQNVTNPTHVAHSDDKFNSVLWVILLIVLCIFLPFIAVVVIGTSQ